MVKELQRGHYAERAKQLGEHIKAVAEGWNLPCVEGVRGLGLLRGVGLKPGSFSVPEGMTPAGYVNGLCREAGLLACPAGADTLRLIPALNIPEELLEEGLSILHGVLAKLA